MSKINASWENVCETGDLPPFVGVRALVAGQQIALFRVKSEVFAIGALDPFTKAAVLARGLVGDIGGEIVVASPLYKQHFSLQTGVCLEDNTVAVPTYPVREIDGKIQVRAVANATEQFEPALSA